MNMTALNLGLNQATGRKPSTKAQPLNLPSRKPATKAGQSSQQGRDLTFESGFGAASGVVSEPDPRAAIPAPGSSRFVFDPAAVAVGPWSRLQTQPSVAGGITGGFGFTVAKAPPGAAQLSLSGAGTKPMNRPGKGNASERGLGYLTKDKQESPAGGHEQSFGHDMALVPNPEPTDLRLSLGIPNPQPSVFGPATSGWGWGSNPAAATTFHAQPSVSGPSTKTVGVGAPRFHSVASSGPPSTTKAPDVDDPWFGSKPTQRAQSPKGSAIATHADKSTAPTRHSGAQVTTATVPDGTKKSHPCYYHQPHHVCHRLVSCNVKSY